MSLGRAAASFGILSAVLFGTAPPVGAQEDAVARLRARVTAAPTDPSLRCQLAFALVGTSAFEEARALADTSVVEIDALPRPLSRPLRSTLGACLYNRGRALEGLRSSRAAAHDYARSLALRPNSTVLTRLEALAPGMRRDLPASAVVVLDRREGDAESGVALIGDGPVTRLSIPGGAWQFLAASVSEHGGFTSLALYGIRWRGDFLDVLRLDEWTQDDQNAAASVVSAQRLEIPEIGPVANVQFTAAGGGTCGRMDGFMDFDHQATVLVALSPATTRARVLVTEQHDCSAAVRMRVRVSGTQVTVSASSGGELEPGTYSISQLLE